MCHLYPYNNVKLLRKFFYINYASIAMLEIAVFSTKNLTINNFVNFQNVLT